MLLAHAGYWHQQQMEHLVERDIQVLIPPDATRRPARSALYIAHLDMQLVEDATYFVHEADGEIVACGGWSRRNKLYTGSGSLG